MSRNSAIVFMAEYFEYVNGELKAVKRLRMAIQLNFFFAPMAVMKNQ